MATPLFSFGIMADCQYADRDDADVQVMGTEDWYYNRYRLSPAKLKKAVEGFNEHELDFVVHLGDFTDKNLDGYEMLTEITNNLKAPLWHVMGNHEYWGVEGDEQRVLATYGLDKSYYSKQVGGYRFIVLDTNELGEIKHVPGTDEWKKGHDLIEQMKAAGEINAYGWNGGLSDEQLSWLDAELDAADAGGEHAILFAHHPVFPPGVLNALNQGDILNMIDAHRNVVAFINGHNHNGDFGIRNNVPYLTVPGMLNTSTNAYGIVDIYEDKIIINGHGRVSDMQLDIAKQST